MFLHIWKIVTLLKSIKNLRKKMVYLFLNPLLYDLIQYNQYDTIYHEPSLLQFIKFKILI